MQFAGGDTDRREACLEREFEAVQGGGGFFGWSKQPVLVKVKNLQSPGSVKAAPVALYGCEVF